MESAHVEAICTRLDRVVELLEEVARKLPEPIVDAYGRHVLPVRDWRG